MSIFWSCSPISVKFFWSSWFSQVSNPHFSGPSFFICKLKNYVSQLSKSQPWPMNDQQFFFNLAQTFRLGSERKNINLYERKSKTMEVCKRRRNFTSPPNIYKLHVIWDNVTLNCNVLKCCVYEIWDNFVQDYLHLTLD